MQNQTFYSDRQFQMWSYIVSHSQLLLRSPKAPGLPTRIEVLFKDVSLIHLETSLDGLSICEVEWSSADLPVDISQVPTRHRLFRVATNAITGYVAAAAFFSSEDEKEYYDDSGLAPAEHL
jgi:hypothetical protein